MAKKLIKEVLRLGGVELRRYNTALSRYKSLYRKYQHYTMIPEGSFILNLDLCSHYKHVQGDYVECGVWRGGMSAAISELLNQDTTIHLFDSFEGLPAAKEIDGKDALAWQKDITSPTYFDNCKAEEADVLQAMKLAQHHRFQIHKGWFEHTVPQFEDRTISILRLDGDWYDSVMICLDHLFPKVTEGGIILLDDYHTWEGCARATHDYLSRTKAPSRIFQWSNQIAYIIKKN